MATIQQANGMLNGTGGSGFCTIPSKWFSALVGSSLGEQANRLLNSIRRAIFDGQVAALFGAGPCDG